MSHTTPTVFTRLLDGLYLLGAVLSGLSVVVIVVLVLGEVVAREAFKTSFQVSVEYSTYLLVSATFFGLAYTQRAGQMIFVGLVYDTTTGLTRAWMDLARSVIAVVFGGMMTWYVAKFTYYSYSLEQVSMTVARTPLYLPQLTMVLGMFLVTVEWIRGALDAIRQLRGTSRKHDN